MADIKRVKDFPTARIFRIILIIMTIVYSISFVVYLFVEGPKNLKFLGSLQDPGVIVSNVVFFLQGILAFLIYLAIFYNLNCLIIMIAKGEPFHPANPKRIRRVAQGAFALLLPRGLLMVAQMILPSAFHQRWEASVSFLAGEGLRMILFGVGILIIAHVFDAGVKLRQSEDLTI